MRTVEETCRHCYWSATTRDEKILCNRELGSTKKSVPVGDKDSCERWIGDRAK